MNFDFSRLRRSDQIIGASAIAFFIFLFFFKWYGGSASSSLGGASYGGSTNGWNTFTNSRWIWLITIIVALGSTAVSAGMLKIESPIQPGVLVAGLGALSAILILYRIIDHPSGGVSGSVNGVSYSASYGIKIGIWLGLIATLAMTYGGYLAMQDEGTSLTDVRQQAGGAIGNLGSSGSSPSTAAPPSGGGEPEVGAPPIPPPADPSPTQPPAPPQPG